MCKTERISRNKKAKIVLIRHGMTQGNQEHRYVGTTDEGLLPESVEDLRGMQEFWQKQVPMNGRTVADSVHDFGFFPQTRGAHFLVRVRGGCNHLYHNLSLKIRVDMIVDNLTPFGANSRESSVLLTAILSRCGSGADEFGQAFDFLLGSDMGNA